MKKGFLRAYLFTILALLALSTTVMAEVVTTADPPGGSYIAAQNVRLKTSEPATVYCTTDGTIPQMTPDYLCGTSIPIARDTVLTFFSVDQFGVTEQTRTETYVITGGELRAWGANNLGQLGDGTTYDRYSPVPVIAGGVVSASAGKRGHSVILKRNGIVWAWGDNMFGQLGDGTNISRDTPAPVPWLSDVVAVSAGNDHTAALKGDGTVWTWGNGYYQLGNGYSISYRPQPVPITNVTAVSTGENHTLALKKDGTVWAWGPNGSGQIGDGTTYSRMSPVQVVGLTDVISISAGAYHSMALKKDGTVWAWGSNQFGKLGDGTTVDRWTPIQVTEITDVKSISAGASHTVALKTDGTVWAWGYNYYGQLGDGTTIDRLLPVQVVGLSDVASVSAGYPQTSAVKTDGTVWAWAAGWGVMLGNGTYGGGSLVPVQNGILNAGALSSGSLHYLVLVQSPITGTYSITATAEGPYVAIFPSGTIEVFEGESLPVTIEAMGGYIIADVLVDGVSVGPVRTYNFSNVNANHTISATAKRPTITATAGPNGSISPSGTVEVTGGFTSIVTMTPDYGYKVADVVVDGISVGPVTSYVFENVSADHTISATFTINTYTITASAGAGGLISPSGAVMVSHGGSQSFSITPSTGYHVADVVVDGSSVGAVGSYIFTNVTTNHTISPTFAINTYTIAASAGAGGAISPSGDVMVNHGDGRTFTITPNAGYSIADVLVDGSSVGTVTSYTFSNVVANHSIGASYIQNTITVTSPNGGENWKKGTIQNITWSYTGNPGATAKIELLKGGVVNKTISSGTSIGSNGTGSFTWTVPQGQVLGTDYTIRITSTSDGSKTDTSDSNFTISR